MTTPKQPDNLFDSVKFEAISFPPELARPAPGRPPPAPAKARETARPAERAAPAAPAKPVAPAAAPAAPPTGLEQPATEVCRRFPLGDAARPLLKDGQKTRAFLQTLVDAKLFVDAIKVLAHAVSRREAVWWACQCCRQGTAAELPPRTRAAVEAAEGWAADPTEDNRRAAYAAAEGAGFDTPAGCAAVAAFYSGGSLGPPHVPVIPPGEWFTAHAAAGAIQLAVAAVPPRDVVSTYHRFLARGVAVAEGIDRWKAPPAAESKLGTAAGRAR